VLIENYCKKWYKFQVSLKQNCAKGNCIKQDLPIYIYIYVTVVCMYQACAVITLSFRLDFLNMILLKRSI